MGPFSPVTGGVSDSFHVLRWEPFELEKDGGDLIHSRENIILILKRRSMVDKETRGKGRRDERENKK